MANTSLVVDIRTNTQKFVDGMNQVNKRIAGFEKKISSISKTVIGFAAAGGLATLAKSSLDNADKLQKLSIRLGASTEALSELEHVANLSGVSFDTLTMGLQRMTRRVAEAAQGTGEAKAALKELNLSATNLSKLAPEKQYEMIADALSGLASDSDRVRLAMKLFDSEGVALIQTMTGGSQGIRDMREEANRLGLTISKEMADNAALANDSISRLTSSFSALTNAIVARAAPAIKSVADAILDIVNPEVSKSGKKTFNEISDAAIEYGNSLIRIENINRSLLDKQKPLEDAIVRLTSARERDIERASKGVESERALQAIREGFTKKYQEQINSLTEAQSKSSILLNQQLEKEKQKRDEAKQKIDEYVESSKKAASANIKYSQSTEDWAKGMAESAKDFVSLQDQLYPEDAAARKWLEDYKLLAQFLSGDELNAAVEQLNTKFAKASDKQKSYLDDLKSEWESAGNAFANSIGYAVADQIMQQEKFADVAREAARSFAREMIASMVAIAAKRAAMWAIEKAQLIATAATAAPAAASVTLASAGTNVPVAIAGMGAAAAASQALFGVAHDGLSYVPQDGTYLLQKGEKVVSNEDSRKLDSMMNGGGRNIVNINISAMDSQDVVRVLSSPMSKSMIETFSLNAVRRSYYNQGRSGGP